MITCYESISEEKKILSTEGFFRKSTFCTLTVAKPGFDGHLVMSEIFLLNGTFTMLEMTVKHFFQFHAAHHKGPNGTNHWDVETNRNKLEKVKDSKLLYCVHIPCDSRKYGAHGVGHIPPKGTVYIY